MKPINRGYTRAFAYLFDSDDDAPMPKPHPGIPLSLHPPPPKQRCQVESARSAESARVAKHCTERLHPYEPATQRVRSTVPATVHELVAPPHPAVPATKPTRAPAASASKSKPAKGCMRWQDPVKPGTPWPKPPISKGFDNVGDGAPWRSIAVGQYHRMSWPLWGRGVTDLRPIEKSVMVAGRLLRHALNEATRMIGQVPCEHKIGICRCPHERFFFYQEENSKWKPWLLVLLASTATRERGPA